MRTSQVSECPGCFRTSRVEHAKDTTLRIQVCPKKGISPTILLWGWDWDHQTYSREGYGSLGLCHFSSSWVLFLLLNIVIFALDAWEIPENTPEAVMTSLWFCIPLTSFHATKNWEDMWTNKLIPTIILGGPTWDVYQESRKDTLASQRIIYPLPAVHFWVDKTSSSGERCDMWSFPCKILAPTSYKWRYSCSPYKWHINTPLFRCENTNTIPIGMEFLPWPFIGVITSIITSRVSSWRDDVSLPRGHNPSLPVIPCEDRCLAPQTPPEVKAFRWCKNLYSQGIWRRLED